MDDGADPAIVQRRLVLFFPGFEPLGAEHHHKRFVRALQTTGSAYSADFVATPLQQGAAGQPEFAVAGRGDGWQTDTRLVLFDWSHVLEHFRNRPVWRRLASGLFALATFAFNGTLIRYLKTSWRYGLFFFYPVLLMAGILLVASAVSTLAAGLAGKLSAFALVTAILATVAAFKAHLLLMMDDWAFANALAEGGDPVIEKTRDDFAKSLAAELVNNDAEEILIVGHSLGCVFAVDALGQARGPEADQVSLMTTGSSLMKIALDRRATWLCERIASLVANRQRWLDVQSLTDVISFFGSNPARTVGISGPVMPLVLAIRFRAMLTSRTYAKLRYNFFRMHRQFVLAVECRYPYSLHMMACGPERFKDVHSNHGLTRQSRTRAAP